MAALPSRSRVWHHLRAFSIRHPRLTAAPVALLLAGVAISAYHSWRNAAAGGDYFPLAPGHHWRYAVSYEGDDVPADQMQVLRVDRRVQLGEHDTAVRRDELGLEYYLVADASGIYRVARKNDVEEQATLDPAPRYVLKQPFAVGSEWVADTVPYLLRRKNEFPRELRDSHRVSMSYRIERVGETVEVPAGTFSGCLLVQGSAAVRLYTDPVNGFNDVPLITREWYCPGVGLARYERDELVRSGFMTGGRVRAVLVGHDRP